jgi:hypothetical protein
MLDESYRPAVREGDLVRVRTRDCLTGGAAHAWLRTESEPDTRIVADLTHRLTGRGSDQYAAMRDLQAVASAQALLLCCATCCFLQLTGMSRQMSGGLSGYCLAHMPEHGRSLADLVSIYDDCDRFSFCAEPADDEVRMRLWKERAGNTDDG